MYSHVRCTFCKKGYDRPAGRVKEAQKFKWKQYCSIECMSSARRRGQMLICSRSDCSKKFYRPRLQIAKVEFSYCSHTCSALVNNQRFPRKTRELKNCERDECVKKIPLSQRYCSIACYSAARLYSEGKLLEKLQETAKQLNRTPTKRELPDIAHACIWAFGSWNNAIVKAGLEPHRSHSQRMFKRMNTKALDGHTCDSISEAIIDNWLTKHRILHSRDVPYPETGHKADWGIGNKIFVEYFGLAYDSPRYDKSIREKRALCKKSKIKLVEIYPSDLYPIVKLNEKFPKELTQYQITSTPQSYTSARRQASGR